MGAQYHLAGVPALEAAEDPGDTFPGGKGELTPLELCAAMGCSFLPVTWQCRRAQPLLYSHTNTAWAGIERQPQMQMPQDNTLTAGIYPLLSGSQNNAKIQDRKPSSLYFSWETDALKHGLQPNGFLSHIETAFEKVL